MIYPRTDVLLKEKRKSFYRPDREAKKEERAKRQVCPCGGFILKRRLRTVWK